MAGAQDVDLEARALAVLHPALPEIHRLPIDLADVLRNYGFGPVLFAIGTNRHGAIQRVKGRLHPVVYRSREANSLTLSARERFTVAHEIAHSLLDGRLDLVPKRTRDYWRLENACNDFAGRLLIPERRLLRIANQAAPSLVGLLHDLFKLSDEAAVSIPVAARRFADVVPTVSVISVERINSVKFRAPTVRVKWVAGADILRVATGSHLHPESPLVQWVMTTSSSRYTHLSAQGIEAAAWNSQHVTTLAIREEPGEVGGQLSLFALDP